MSLFSTKEFSWKHCLRDRLVRQDFVSTVLRVTVSFDVNFVFLGAKLSLRLVELWWEIELGGQHFLVFRINISTLGPSGGFLLLWITYQLRLLRQSENCGRGGGPFILYLIFDTTLSGSPVTYFGRSCSIAFLRRLHWRFTCFALRADNVPGRFSIFLLAIKRYRLSRATLA